MSTTWQKETPRTPDDDPASTFLIRPASASASRSAGSGWPRGGTGPGCPRMTSSMPSIAGSTS